ncbi:MAG: divalent-cation tolerance protein CutA [Syntrophobacter sp.]
MDEVSVVFVTAGGEEEAARIGRALVEEKLAACANMVPRIRSIYRWKGEIHDEQEVLLLIKTRSSLFPTLRDRVKQLHSYEVPEIVAFPLTQGLPDYLAWVCAETSEF